MLSDFCEITQTSVNEDNVVINVQLNSKHDIYNGHFPNMPVLPGVCTLYVVRKAISHYMNKDVDFAYISSCKFVSTVNPQESNKLVLNFKNKENNKIEAIVSSNDNIILKLKADIK